MIHLASIGTVYEGPGLTGKAVAILNAPTSTLCGIRAANKDHGLDGVRVVMPHDDPKSCRSCLKLLPSRTSEVVPMLMAV